MKSGGAFAEQVPETLEEVAQPSRSGLVTLDEIRGCCAIIAKELIRARLAIVPPARPAAAAPPSPPILYRPPPLPTGSGAAALAWLRARGTAHTLLEIREGICPAPTRSALSIAMGRLLRAGRVTRQRRSGCRGHPPWEWSAVPEPK